MAEQEVVGLGVEAEEYLSLKKKVTAATYRTHLNRFLKWYKSEYGEDKGFEHFFDLMDENQRLPRRDRKHVAEAILVKYIDYLKDERKLANYTIRTSFTAIQNFLKSKHFEMSALWVGNLPPATAKKDNGKHRWTLEQIKEFVDKAPSYRDKAAILVMFQSGMAVSELCSLNYGDVEAQLRMGERPILIEMVRQKVGVEYRTCLGADAINCLEAYLKTRKNLKFESPLFTKIGSEERLTRMALQGRFREIAADLSFVTLKKGSLNPARPHSMRSAFRSRLTNKAAEAFINYMMGHKLSGTEAAYLNMPNEDLRADYADIEEFLSIETTSKDVLAGRPKEGEQSFLIGAYQERLGELEMKNEALSRMVGSLAEKMGMRDAFIEMLGYDPDLESGEVKYNPEKDQRRE